MIGPCARCGATVPLGAVHTCVITTSSGTPALPREPTLETIARDGFRSFPEPHLVANVLAREILALQGTVGACWESGESCEAEFRERLDALEAKQPADAGGDYPMPGSKRLEAERDAAFARAEQAERERDEHRQRLNEYLEGVAGPYPWVSLERLEAVERERDEWKAAQSRATRELVAAQRERDEAREGMAFWDKRVLEVIGQRAALREALAKYGRHDATRCNAKWNAPATHPNCTCGLRNALTASRTEVTDA